MNLFVGLYFYFITIYYIYSGKHVDYFNEYIYKEIIWYFIPGMKVRKIVQINTIKIAHWHYTELRLKKRQNERRNFE